MSKPLERQDWLEPDALDRFEQESDPLSVIFEKSRARRMGADYVPDPLPKRVTPAPATIRPPAPPPVTSRQSPLSPTFVAGANRELSGSAFKILLAIAVKGDGCYPAALLSQWTRLTLDTILKAVRECLDYGWLERHVLCSLCDHESNTDARLVDCPNCKRRTPAKHQYKVLCPLETGDTEILGTPADNSGTPTQQSTPQVPIFPPPPTQNPGTGTENSGTPLPKKSVPAPQISGTPAAKPGTGTENLGTPHAHAESIPESNITNDSDSEYMRSGTGNGTGNNNATTKSETEQLAQASCQALETSTTSLGMHIKAWAHARQLDAQTTTKPHQTALQAIQKELAAQRKETNQPQGKAWTRRVYDYFQSQGHPLPRKSSG